MAAVIDCLRGEHKNISKVLFQLLPLVQQHCGNDRQKTSMIEQLQAKLLQLDQYIGGIHFNVEALMMQKLASKDLDESNRILVDHMLKEHELFDVLSELLDLRIEEYKHHSDKKAVLIRAVNQYVNHHIHYINRQQMQLFELCDQKLNEQDWQPLKQLYAQQPQQGYNGHGAEVVAF